MNMNMNIKNEITFMDVRDTLIKINPIDKWYPKIKHGFITSDACSIYDMAVMYTCDTLNSYRIDFMDINAIKNDSRPGSTISTGIYLGDPFKMPSFFTLDGLIFEENDEWFEKSITYSLGTTLMQTYHNDIHKLYHKWRSFMIDLVINERNNCYE